MGKNVLILSGLLVLVGCSEPVEPKPASKPAVTQVGESVASVEREHDIAQIVRGAAIFKQNCAECHGANGEGAANWRQRDANDKFPPPPLNGDGHSWHHPLNALRHTIRNGTLAIGGSMPAWKGKLSDADIDAVIAWFQSKWPDQAYASWYDIDQRARKRKQ